MFISPTLCFPSFHSHNKELYIKELYTSNSFMQQKACVVHIKEDLGPNGLSVTWHFTLESTSSDILPLVL